MDETLDLKDIPPEYCAYLKKVAKDLKAGTRNGNNANGNSQRQGRKPFPTYKTGLIQGTFERSHAYDSFSRLGASRLVTDSIFITGMENQIDLSDLRPEDAEYIKNLVQDLKHRAQ